MECRSCADLRWDIDYLETRNNELLNKEIEWEIQEEKLLIRQGELEDRIADLEKAAEEDRDLKKSIALQLSRYRLERQLLSQEGRLALAEHFINNLLTQTIGDSKTCQFLV